MHVIDSPWRELKVAFCNQPRHRKIIILILSSGLSKQLRFRGLTSENYHNFYLYMFSIIIKELEQKSTELCSILHISLINLEPLYDSTDRSDMRLLHAIEAQRQQQGITCTVGLWIKLVVIMKRSQKLQL